MTRVKLSWLLTIFLCFLVAMTAFGLPVCSAKEKQTIKIGALLSLSGEWSEHGTSAQKALTTGLDQVNHYLADSGLKFELDIRNTAGNPQEALRQLDLLAGQGIQLVIGPMSSEEANAVNDFATGHSMLLLSPSATATELAKKDNFFRVIPNDSKQAEGLMKTMTTERFSRFIVVYRDDAFGRGFCEQLQKAAVNCGNTMAGSIALPAASGDFEATVEKLTSLAVEEDRSKTAIMLIGSAQDAAKIIRHIEPNNSLAAMKWFACADIVTSKELLADKKVAAFAAKVQMEGMATGYKGIALDVMPYINYTLNGAAEVSPYALPAWDSLWLLAETCRRNPQADIESLKTELVATAGQFRNSFGLINVMDENGDTSSARFLRYQLYDEGEGSYVWRCRGHYVNPIISPPIIQTLEPQIRKESGEIRIGALLSLRGSTGEAGRQVQAVLQEAASCFNQYAAASGSGLTVTLQIEDTASDPQTAAVATKKLLAEGVRNFIGPISSAELAAVAPLLNATEATCISPTATATSLSQNDHIYRLIMNDKYQGKALAALMKQDAVTQVIVLYRDDVYGRNLSEAFSAAYDGKVIPLSYNQDARNFDGILQQAEQLVEKTGTDHTAVLLVAYDEAAKLLRLPTGSHLNEVRWYGTDSTALTSVLVNDRQAAETAARVQFTALAYSAYGNYFDPLYRVMNYRVSNTIAHPLQESSLSAFDALWMIGCAYLDKGILADRDTVNRIIQTSVFRGVSGLVAMDENGDRKIGYYRIYRLDADKGKYRWLNTGLYSLDYAKKGVVELAR